MFREVTLESGRKVYQAGRVGMAYQRFKDGLGWPQGTSGFIVIIGEEFTGDDLFKPLRVFHEEELQNLEMMVRSAARLQILYPIDGWVCDLTGDLDSYTHFFFDFQIAQKKKNPHSDLTFALYERSIPPDFSLSREIIGRRFDNNTLSLPEEGILRARIEKAHNEDPRQPDLASRYPEIITLASVIDGFDRNPYDPTDPPLRRRRPPPSPMAV